VLAVERGGGGVGGGGGGGGQELVLWRVRDEVGI